MSGWSMHTGEAIRLMLDNVDTDQLLPARFMSQPRSAGYGEFLFYDVRRDELDTLRSSFALNRHPHASVLISGRNFGSGSSREAAVYALVDAGIKVIISTSFGDIFAANAVNNGLLPALVSNGNLKQLAEVVEDGVTTITADLESMQIRAQSLTITFDLDATWATKLRNGWDDIDLTLNYANTISQFKNKCRQQRSWAWPEPLRVPPRDPTENSN